MDPTTTIVRRDLSMTYAEFHAAVNRSRFIGLRVLPPLAVSQESANFQRIDCEQMQHGVEDTRRQPDGTYRRDEGRWKEDSYSLQEHGVEERIDYGKVERWGDLIRFEDLARVRAINRMLTRFEYDIAQSVFNTTTWASYKTNVDVVANGSSGEKWTVKASADPIIDIDLASDATKSQCGVRANALVASYKAYRAMLRTDRIESLLKQDGVQILINALSGIVPDTMAVEQASSSLLQVLQLEKILVGDAAYNSADKGQSPTFSNFWSETLAMVCRIEDDGFNGDLEMPRPHIGRTLFSTKNSEPVPGMAMGGEDSLIFEEYEDNPSRGKFLRPRNKRGLKMMQVESGHLLTNVT